MRALLIEDDPNKVKQVSDFLLTRHEAQVDVRRSYSSGLRAIRAGTYDVVLLDMSLPNFDPGLDDDAGRFRSYAGREILQQMKRRCITIPVIVITQYEAFSSGDIVLSLSDLAAELKSGFSEAGYRGIVFYSASQDDWKAKLSDLINPAAEGQV